MLTSHDLEQIEKLFIKFEKKLSNKIDERADQTIEYINANIETHEKWLRDHEKRITKLESHSSYLIRDAKKE